MWYGSQPTNYPSISCPFVFDIKKCILEILNPYIPFKIEEVSQILKKKMFVARWELQNGLQIIKTKNTWINFLLVFYKVYFCRQKIFEIFRRFCTMLCQYIACWWSFLWLFAIIDWGEVNYCSVSSNKKSWQVLIVIVFVLLCPVLFKSEICFCLSKKVKIHIFLANLFMHLKVFYQ